MSKKSCTFAYRKEQVIITTQPSTSRTSQFYERRFLRMQRSQQKEQKKGNREMPFASKVIAVVGGYMGFESWDDYYMWKNQK